MKRDRSSLRLLGAFVFGLLLAGCSSYESDSSPKSSAVLDLASPDREPIAVTVDKIDDGSASAWGVFKDSKLCDLSAGSHSITLAISDYLERDPQVMGGKSSLKARETVSFVFVANHKYRFAATRTGLKFDLVLWDETSGSKTDVQHWPVDALSDYQPFTS